ncbi:hypothetical protein AX774_g4971 [Zancudomyces culisetae]|uniref:Uncharacterized protein n=1 Tax=Zancudomyces culisetae TaxID=1213189 RepID=A0A1R1PKT7_ZANCU|nr:hypothetical protein AX774_g4971 [Zancudomyces culisetae]|eukprot:OMH81580.1 hypothetical protein AX774_g4971 [Zancudomyces culisetae]
MKVLSYDLDNRIDSLQVEHIVTTFEDPNPGQGDGWNGGEIAHANNNESRLIILPKFMQNSMSRYGGESVQSTKQEIQKCDENVALRYYENYEIVQEDLLSLAGGERKTIWIPCMMEKSIVEQVCKEDGDGDNDFGNIGRHGKRKRNHGDSKNVIQGKLEIVGHRECIFRIQNDLGRMSGTKPSISSDGRKGGKSKTVEELVSEMEELDYKIIDTPSSTLLQSADRSFADGINPQKNIVLDNILGTVNITVGVLNDAQRSKHEQQQINISCSNELVLQDVMGVLNSGY